MIDKTTIFEIHRLKNLSLSVRHIAKRLNLSRKTVKKYIEEPIASYTRNVPKPSKLIPYYDIIDQALAQSPRVKATVIFQRLREEGFDGGDGIVRKYLLKKCGYRKKIEFLPQVDFTESDHIWMLRLLQGKIGYNKLEKEFSGKLNKESIRKLRFAILNRPLRYRNRAITIFSYFRKIPQRSIARFLCTTRTAVRNYIDCFTSRGVEGLFDRSKGKVKKSDDPKYKEAVFQILHAPPSSYNINRTTWRMQDLRRILAEKGFGLSNPCIRKIIKEAGYRFRKAKRVLTSNDPHYREKLQRITAILSNLGSKEKFFSIDEFGPFAVKKRGGKTLVANGEDRTIPQWQKSKGSLIVTASLELSTNQITHFYSKRKNTNEMIKLLDVLLKEYVDECCIYFSWDAASWHASKKLYKKVEEINSKEYRKIHNTPIVQLAPLPTCAQFLNVIESVFSGMARAIIHNSDYQSVEECKVAINRYFAERNQYFLDNPKRAGNKIWGDERVEVRFKESNNCKDPHYQLY